MYKVCYAESALSDLKAILDFITLQDCSKRAIPFVRHLFQLIEKLSALPYRCRKSLYYNSDQYRDMVIKGFTVTYKVDDSKRVIYVLGVFRSRDFQ